jgi:hypothetical protein
MPLPKAVGLVGAPAAPVVDLLERLLAEARAGRIRSVLCAYEYDSGSSSHAWAWGEHTSRLLLVGEAERAKARLLQRTMAEAGDLTD